MDTKTGIERDVLNLFSQSVGWPFRLKGGVQGVQLSDVVAGVDWQLMHVVGRTYGSFHVSLCELMPYETKLDVLS